jgi:hypothetical protein
MKKPAASQIKILQKYVKLVEKLGRFPTNLEVQKAGITRNLYRHHFLNLEGIQAAAKKEFPQAFAALFSSDDFTPARFKGTKEALRDVDEFIITTVVAGCDVFEEALAAVDRWSKETGGMLLCQPIKDPAQSHTGGQGNFAKDFFDPMLADYDFVWKTLKLNNKVTVSDILQSAKQLNPHTGLERISDNTGLTVIASPKVRLTPLANMEGQPGYLCSAGSITLANYESDMYMSQRTAKFGYAEHMLGGLYVKLLGKNRYEFTPIEFNKKNGSFVIDGKHYSADGKSSEVSPQIITFGDLHIEELSDFMRAEFLRIIKEEKPVEIDLHDVFSGIACSPFNKRKPELQYLESREYKTATVQADLARVGELLNTAAGMAQVNVIDSNHHKFLEYWISSGAYRIGHAADIMFAHKLAEAWLRCPEIPILKTAILCAGVQLNSSIKFHLGYKSFKFAGIERSQHGHASSRGKAGTLTKMLEELGPCNYGHTHLTQIVGRAWNVGTFSGIGDRRPAYAKQGANKQSNSYIRIYANGHRELVHIFEE